MKFVYVLVASLAITFLFNRLVPQGPIPFYYVAGVGITLTMIFFVVLLGLSWKIVAH